MQLTPEQQKAIDAQKEQCPFCKIVKGEIQSKKVYEDEKIIAILDINPAAKGHLLIMPKEHYPIMPLMPTETFEHLFSKTQSISRALKEAMLVFGDTIYIANGYAAGQQSSHFMLHLIPREEIDELDFFKPKNSFVPKHKADEAQNALKQVLPLMLKQRYMKYPIAGKEPDLQQQSSSQKIVAPQAAIAPEEPAVIQKEPLSPTKAYILKLIDNNPQLKEFIIKYPQQFRKQVSESPKLKKLFEHVDVDEIIEHFAPAKQESKYSMKELVEIINDNPRLKELLLKQTFLFTEKVAQIPELKEIFEGVDVEELERAVMIQNLREEEDVKDILGTFAEKIPKKPINQDAHLEVPDTENPALIQEEDPSIEKIEDNDKKEKKAELDLISRLYGDFSQKK